MATNKKPEGFDYFMSTSHRKPQGFDLLISTSNMHADMTLNTGHKSRLSIKNTITNSRKKSFGEEEPAPSNGLVSSKQRAEPTADEWEACIREVVAQTPVNPLVEAEPEPTDTIEASPGQIYQFAPTEAHQHNITHMIYRECAAPCPLCQQNKTKAKYCIRCGIKICEVVYA